MKRLAQSNHAITDAFVYCLMGLFALGGVLMALLGAKAYRSVAENARDNTEIRLPAAFVRTIARSADAAKSVVISEEEGIQTLAFTEEYDGVEYITRVYCFNGALCTSMTEADGFFDPFLGDSVCSLDDFSALWNGNILTVNLTYENGDTESVSVYMYCDHQ